MTASVRRKTSKGFRDKWPFAARYARVNGWRMHYVDEGAGDPILLLHGNPTWGFPLSRRHPAAGERGTPRHCPRHDRLRPFREAGPRAGAQPRWAYCETLTEPLVRQLDLQRLTVVCHDWGGPTGLGFAMSNPGRVRALTVMSTWAWPTPPAEFHTRVFPWRMMHAPLVGPYLLGRHNVLARRGVYLSVVGRDKFRREAQAVYEAVLPDAETRLLTWVWPRWIPLDDTARAQARFAWLEAELAKSKLPTLIIWGSEDEVFDAATFAERFKRLLPHAEGPHMVTGRHFLQEDSGPEIAELIAAFLDRQGGV